MKRSAFALVRVVRGGIEPPTFRFSGAFAASLHVAGCGLMGDLPATTMAGCRLMGPGVCLGGFQPSSQHWPLVAGIVPALTDNRAG